MSDKALTNLGAWGSHLVRSDILISGVLRALMVCDRVMKTHLAEFLSRALLGSPFAKPSVKPQLAFLWHFPISNPKIGRLIWLGLADEVAVCEDSGKGAFLHPAHRLIGSRPRNCRISSLGTA